MELPHKIEEIRGIIIETFGSSVGAYGMNETIGRIYGLLYFEDEPLSLAKIAEHLVVSKATISINIRLLLDLKMVHKVWKKGSRKDFYTAERDFEKIAQEVLRNKELKQISLIQESIVRSMEKYKEILGSEKAQEINEIVRLDIEKLENLKVWIHKGELWLNFFLETNYSDLPTEDIKEIEVEWDD